MSNDNEPKVDVAGTAPGLQGAPKPEPKKLAMKCRYDGCPGTQAIEVPMGASHGESGAPSQRIYQCTTCQATWGLPVGGHFPF